MKQRIQIALALGIAVAALRVAYIFYERHAEENAPIQREAAPLDADYYVTPKKLHPYDLKSARQLAQQPVWVKEGYRYTFYPYNAEGHRADFSHEAGLLLPIQRLEIKDVVTDVSPGSNDQRQVMAVFTQEGKRYAFPIGSVKDGNYQIYSDEILYIQDPHELYKHWPADIWDAIGKHEVKPGMNELQADFAVGMGVLEHSGDSEVRILDYANGGMPLRVIYRNGRAVDVQPRP